MVERIKTPKDAALSAALATLRSELGEEKYRVLRNQTSVFWLREAMARILNAAREGYLMALMSADEEKDD